MRKTEQNGFTLVEVMIVVVIIGILSAIVFPIYTEQVREGRRTRATGDLLQLANEMERDFTLNGAYTDLITAGTFPNQSPTEGGSTAAYTLSVTVPAVPQSYVLTAVPVGAHAVDACGTLTYNSQGTKTFSGGGVTMDDCWQ